MTADEVREQILDAAVRLLRGGTLPSMGVVAQAAGVSRATLYRRFASTESLLDALSAERAAATAAAARTPRERLLVAARRHFARQGVGGTSVAVLVEEAQVSTATMYTLFGDKAGLLQALVVELTEDLPPRLQAGAGGMETAARLVREQAPLLRLLFSPEWSPHAEPLRVALRAALCAAAGGDGLVGDTLLAVALYGDGDLEGVARRLGGR